MIRLTPVAAPRSSTRLWIYPPALTATFPSVGCQLFHVEPLASGPTVGLPTPELLGPKPNNSLPPGPGVFGLGVYVLFGETTVR